MFALRYHVLNDFSVEVFGCAGTVRQVYCHLHDFFLFQVVFAIYTLRCYGVLAIDRKATIPGK